MSNILYRFGTQNNNQQVLELIAKGYEIQEANQTLAFDNIEDTFKYALYNAALKYGDMLRLEQVFQAKWLELKGTKIQLVGLPNLLEFVMPYEYYPADDGVNVGIELINPKQKEEEYIRLPIMVDRTERVNINTTLPNTLLKDFGYLMHRGVHLEKVALLLQSLWYQRDSVLYPCTEETILEQVKQRANLTGHIAPASLKGSVQYSLPRGSTKEVFGYTIPAFVLPKIIANVTKTEWVTAENQPDTKGVNFEPGTKGKTVTSFDMLQFGEYVLNKLRPFNLGKGTVPFNISTLALLSSFLWETRKEIPHANINGLPDRKELVSLINKIHQYRYHKWLKDSPNTPDKVLEYFEASTHWSQTDSAIKHGIKLYKEVPEKVKVRTDLEL